MTDSFNLTSEPWIPCEFIDGLRAELSTRDVLVESHRIRSIVDPSPLVTATLHRHLLAVLHRTYQGPQTLNEWCEIARADCFDRKMVESYLGNVRDRMDLFHPTHPFAQTRGLAEQFDPEPIDALALERWSWGAGRGLFQHRPADYGPSMVPAEAARVLLAYHAFAPGGLVRKQGEPTSATAAPLVRAAVVLLRAETLFRTLISNLLLYNPAHSQPVSATKQDAPAWEQEPLPRRLRVKHEPKRVPSGWLDMVTWLSRRIELVLEGERLGSFVRCVGQGMAAESPRDPMVTYRRDGKRGFLSIGIDPQRAFWRNANALFEAAQGEQGRYLRPRTIDQLAQPEVSELLGRSTMYSIEVFGLSAARSRVDMARSERLGAVLKLFHDPDTHEEVEHALSFSEDAVNRLQGALYTLARHLLPLPEADNREQRDERWQLVRSFGIEAALWNTLGVAFDAFLRTLAEDKAVARENFEAHVLQEVRNAFSGAVSGVLSDGRSIQARAVAEDQLWRALGELSGTVPTSAPQPERGEETNE